MEIYKKNHAKIINSKVYGRIWNEEFELPDWSYSVSDIQDYFEFFFKKNPAVKFYINKIENRIKFQIKAG